MRAPSSSGVVLPVAVEVAIPVDAAREAGAGEGVDVDLQLGVGEQRLAERLRILHHLDQVRHAAAGREPRLDVRQRHAPPHELAEHAPHVARERRSATPGCLEVHDVVVVAERRAHQRDGRHRRARQIGRVDADHARRARRMEQRHHPDDEAAPVVADEHGALDVERVEQADQVARQMVDVVGGDVVRTVAVAVAALVGRDRAEPGGDERGHLVAPGVRQLGKAVAEHDGRAAALVAHREAICRSWRRRDS